MRRAEQLPKTPICSANMLSQKRNRSRAAITAALTLSLLAALPFATAASAAGNAAAGETTYKAKCSGCHSLDANRIGPAHRGIVGRRIATVPGFSYSSALKKIKGVWSPARLDQWLKAPQKFAPGSKMFLAVPDAAQRQNIIAYLQSVPSKPSK